MLAVRMIQEQGCEVAGVNYYTTFAGDHDYQFKVEGGSDRSARKAAEELGIALQVIDLTMPFQRVLRAPRYGFGSVINPCLDCKLFFIEEAYRLMQKGGYDFLITGEVVGQRPMSQRIDTLPLAIPITNNRIVRPLSARLLPESYPEQMGWLDRAQLGAIRGRNRSEQMALARKFGLQWVPQPAGGCLLTDPGFGRSLRDFLRRYPTETYSPEQLKLLRVGRHLNVSPTLKLIVGHNQWENQWLQQHPGVYFWAQAEGYPGATVVIQVGTNCATAQPALSDDTWQLIAKVALYFSKVRKEGVVGANGRVEFYRRAQLMKLVEVAGMLDTQLLNNWYL